MLIANLLRIAAIVFVSLTVVRDDFAVTWSPGLKLNRLSDVAERLGAPEHAPTFDEPLMLTRQAAGRAERRNISTCADYLVAKSDGFVAPNNLIVGQERAFIAECYVLRDLQAVKNAVVGFVPREWSADVLRRLPPILLWNDFDGAASHFTTWSAAKADTRITRVTKERLELEDSASLYMLEIMARGDFNGDGFEDLALGASVDSKEGTYRRTDYVVLTSCQPDQPLRVITAKSAPFRLNGTRCP
jgi:hypothetical protein